MSKMINVRKVSDFIYKTIPEIVNYTCDVYDDYDEFVTVTFATHNYMGGNKERDFFTHKHLNIIAKELGDDEIAIKSSINAIVLIIQVKSADYFL